MAKDDFAELQRKLEATALELKTATDPNRRRVLLREMSRLVAEAEQISSQPPKWAISLGSLNWIDLKRKKRRERLLSHCTFWFSGRPFRQIQYQFQELRVGHFAPHSSTCGGKQPVGLPTNLDSQGLVF
jgi:hypothetical protein